MIIKGGARSGGRGLARHLTRADTNELVQVLDVRGTAADDLAGAFKEIEAVAAGTRCKSPLYHASINTARDEQLTPEQWRHSVETLESALGLTDQPRAIVRHIKDGREHVHVVWSRIDAEHMRAISDSNNYRIHEEVARQLEREFGHRQIEGVHTGDRDQPRPVAEINQAEQQQAERLDLPIAVINSEVRMAYAASRTGEAFASNLTLYGHILARGDRRDLVIVDRAGGEHSPRRRLGIKAAEIKAHCADLDLAALPSVAEAQQQIEARQLERAGRDAVPDNNPAAPDAMAAGQSLDAPGTRPFEWDEAIDLDTMRAEARAAWRISPDGRALIENLARFGHRLSWGDEATLVIVDRLGGYHNLKTALGDEISWAAYHHRCADLQPDDMKNPDKTKQEMGGVQPVDVAAAWTYQQQQPIIPNYEPPEQERPGRAAGTHAPGGNPATVNEAWNQAADRAQKGTEAGLGFFEKLLTKAAEMFDAVREKLFGAVFSPLGEREETPLPPPAPTLKDTPALVPVEVEKVIEPEKPKDRPQARPYEPRRVPAPVRDPARDRDHEGRERVREIEWQPPPDDEPDGG